MRVSAIFACLLVLLRVGPSALALAGKEVETKIHDAKILKEGDNISASVGKDEVLIRKFGTNNEKDCKIDSILFAKEVLAADPSINKITVLFYDPSDTTKYSEVVVHASIVKTFASGKMNQDDLLSSLDVVHKRDIPVPSQAQSAVVHEEPAAEKTVSNKLNAQQSPSVLKFDESISYGQFEPMMKDCLKRIVALSSSSQNVDSYVGCYHGLEQSIKAGNIGQTKSALDSLVIGLSNQEKFLARKNATAVASVALAKKQATVVERKNVPVYYSPKDNDVVLWSDPQASAIWDNMGKLHPEFMPVSGPLKLERDYISDTLLERKKHGYDVSRYMSIIVRLNNYASNPRTTAAFMGLQVDNAYKMLGLSSKDMFKWMMNWQAKLR